MENDDYTYIEVGNKDNYYREMIKIKDEFYLISGNGKFVRWKENGRCVEINIPFLNEGLDKILLHTNRYLWIVNQNSGEICKYNPETHNIDWVMKCTYDDYSSVFFALSKKNKIYYQNYSSGETYRICEELENQFERLGHLEFNIDDIYALNKYCFSSYYEDNIWAEFNSDDLRFSMMDIKTDRCHDEECTRDIIGNKIYRALN
jgi:hypothetical protein